MSGAVIGLLGVLAGALVAGVATSYGDRRSRRVDAIATGRLIVSELRTAAEFLNRSADLKLSEDVLPRAPWSDSAPKLAFDVKQKTLDQVHDAYTVIGHAVEADPGKPHAGVGRVQEAAKTLSLEIEKVALRRQRDRALVRVGLAVAVLVALVTSLVVEVQDRSAEAVGESVQAQLGVDYIVDCDPAGEDWACEVALAEGGCPLSSSSPDPEESAPTTAEPGPSPVGSLPAPRPSRATQTNAGKAVAIPFALVSASRVLAARAVSAEPCPAGSESTQMQCSDSTVEGHLTLVGPVPEAPNALQSRTFKEPTQSLFARVVGIVGGSD